MPKNAVSKGYVLQITPPTGGATAGQIIAFGTNRVGVSNHTREAGSTELMTVELEGAWEYDKEVGTAWAAGETNLFYDAGADQLTTTASGNVPAGFAFKNAAAGDATGTVRLTP